MPEFNELGGGALGLNEGLGRVLGMEKLSPAPTLTPEIQAGLDLVYPPEDWWFSLGWRSAGLSQIVPAVAAEFGYLGVRNPAGSGMIITDILLMFCETAAAQAAFNVRSNITDTPTVAAGTISRDLRWGSSVSHGQLIVGAEGAGTGGNIGRFQILASTPFLVPVKYTLGPNSNVVVEGIVVNTAFTAGVWWRERRAKPEELP